MKLTFKNKKEFAEAIIKYGTLYDKDNNKVSFDNNHTIDKHYDSPFMFNNVSMMDSWNKYNEEWNTEPNIYINDKQLIWCWDNNKFEISIRYYDAENDTTFNSLVGSRNGASFDNYLPINDKELLVIKNIISKIPKLPEKN